MATEILSERYSASNHSHTAATTAKGIYVINGRVMMAMNAADANADNVFAYRAEKLRGPKATGEAWAVGVKIYWNATNGNFTTTAAGATLAGIVAETAASADTEGVVDLFPETVA